jgi:hypothetical protein
MTKKIPNVWLGMAAAGVAVACGAAGCGDRNPLWDQEAIRIEPFGLTDAVAVADPTADRVLLLTADAERKLGVTTVRTQRGVRTVRPAPDRSKLFVVSIGDGDARPPAGQPVQGAALEIIRRGAAETDRYPLSEALAGLALDPRGDWAVLYADSSSDALVRNPNELLLVDLNAPPSASNPHPHTLRSFGGRPQRFTFTDPLNLPGGTRRLLVVETELDVAIVDLLRPETPEITFPLTSGQDTRQLRPAGVVISDGEAAASDDARIAIRLANDNTVLLAQMVPADGRDFRPDLNLIDVGGLAADAAFVRTDGGALALAVLVPQRSTAVLIDPLTSRTQDVALPAPYQRLSLVTAVAGAAGTGAAPPIDVALLWDGSARGGGVSFWELGRTAGAPYRSVESVGVTTGVTSVVDVAGKHPELKILGTKEAAFFLLDLKTRTSAPFLTSVQGVSLAPASEGDRAWAYVQGGAELSVVDLQTLHPERMRIDRGIQALFEIATLDATGAASATARSLLAWHQGGNGGVTVYDARPADASAAIDERRNYTGILTEGFDAHN